MNLYAIFLQVFFMPSLNPSLYGTVICPLLMLLLLLFLLDLGVLILAFSPVLWPNLGIYTTLGLFVFVVVLPPSVVDWSKCVWPFVTDC